MKRRSLIIAVSLCILAVIVILGILFVKNSINSNRMSLPENISQVEDFMKSQGSYNTIEKTDEFLNEFSIKDYEEMYAGKINKNNNEVNLISVKFNSQDGAKEYFKNLSQKRLGSIKVTQYEFNLPGYSYITVRSDGIKYYVWRNDKWIVEINGSDTKSVRQVKGEFEEYIK